MGFNQIFFAPSSFKSLSEMSQSYFIFIVFWLCFSIGVTVSSYGLGIGGFRHPGAGLMPFLLGILLGLFSLTILTKLLVKKKHGVIISKKEQKTTGLIKIGSVLLGLFLYSFVLEKIGFLITTWIFLLLLFRIVGNRWITVFAASTATVFLTYVLFASLGVRFPTGILKGWG